MYYCVVINVLLGGPAKSYFVTSYCPTLQTWSAGMVLYYVDILPGLHIGLTMQWPYNG